METTATHEQWNVTWRDGLGQPRTMLFELGRGCSYRVIIADEEDEQHFLLAFLRPPETAMLAIDGGLLSNIKVDENVLLPLSYLGMDSATLASRVMEIFLLCGMNAEQTRFLLNRLPHQLTLRQKRVAGFVRALLARPKVMVYAAVWHGVSQVERQQIVALDEILHHVLPTCTRVFVDYATHTDALLQAQHTIQLRE